MAGVHYMKMRGLLPVLTVLFICLTQTIYSAPLSSYQVSSFTSPDPTLPFNHITINNITGEVYIGARQRLYQLNSDLTLKHTVDTGQCPSPNGNTNNNKLLLVAPSPEDKLIACGSCDGYCETRSLTNISHDDSSTNQLVVTLSDAPTVGAVVLSADFVKDGEGTVDGGLYLFTGISDASVTFPSVSKHSLVDLSPVQRVFQPESATKENICKHLISYMEYLYYFISREDSVYLGRLCRNSLDVKFASYTEIELQCSSHNVIQSAHIGPAGSQLADSLSIESTDDLLYAVFTSGSSSALCIYKMSDVQQSFVDAVLGCLQGDNNELGTTNDYLSRSTCNAFPNTFTLPDTAQCTAYFRDGDEPPATQYRYASGTVPLSASPIFTIPDVIPTSIMTTIERQHTVAFMGDTQGYLNKFNIVNSSFGYAYETVPLGSGSVLQDIFLDESTEQITLATSSDQGSQVLTLDLTNCGQYQTCDECIGGKEGNNGDPYCGWCTLEARCTRYEACPLGDESTRWLSYNALQCVSILDVQPNTLPYHQTQQEITITVQQLPDLRSSFQYMCDFDSYEVSATTTGNTVTCISPPENGLPSIPDGMYFLNLPLSVVSTETSVDFVTTDFFFFDCSLIKSCSSCVTTPFPCDWCVYDNKCTDDGNSCRQSGDTVIIGVNNTDGSENKGQGFCPQLLGATESFLIPVGIPSGYSLSAKNLPTDQSKGLVSYECILDIEGEEVRVLSTTFSETYILCDDKQYMYNGNFLEKNVSVSVEWNGQNSIDDLSETHVTLYKCSVNSGSCSRCLSEEATPSILNCGWCGDDCNVMQSDVCQPENNQFLHQNETQLCSAPVITDFDPFSGPINGQTRLEINGTDIGVVFNDVLQILIQDLECDLNNMGKYYEPGQSVSCMTAISTEVISGVIKITVVSGEGNKTGQSTKEFQYRDPVITGFDPREGPVAGGTNITISGMYLDTGRDITARFRDADCVEISVQDSFATCITSSIPENEQVTVTLAMTFDGEERQFSGYNFIYMPNPVIEDIDRTTSIMSGGLDITVTGVGFDLIQEPRIVVTSLTTNASNSELCNGTETILTCPTPSFPDDAIPARRRRATDDAVIANLSFDFGYVIDGGTIEYFPDPVYENFSGNSQIYRSANKRLEITGMDLTLASTEDDVLVMLGPDGECTVDDLEMNVLRCQLPDDPPQAGNLNGTLGQGDAMNLPAVTVKHGNLWFYPGFVQYSTDSGPSIGLIVGPIFGALVVVIIVMGLAGRFLVKRRQKAIDQQVDELELLEKKIQNRAEEAYHNLQVDMTEVEDQVKGLGIPFVNTQDYARNMLFSGLDILPATADPEYLDADLERAMITFSRQLNNPDFIVKYIQELEERRKSQRRDRVNIASLITVILVSEGNFDYFTKILKRLLEDQISDASDTGRQLKSLFRRTETIVEKLLANWFSLCMYHYLKKHVAKSLYLLYQSIKIQVEKGPIDIITGQSYFSLNFDCLIEEDVPYEEMSLSVVGANGQHEYYVTVLSSDCISQTKQKILDAAYRRQHFVKQSRAHELDLLWYHPGGEQRILRDQDEYNTPTDTSMAVQVNTLRSVGVTSDCRMAVINKVGNLEGHTGSYTPVSPGAKSFYIYEQQGNTDVRDRDYTRIQTQREGFQHCHLIPEDHLQANGNPSKTKLDKEFSAPHLLVTKKTIEPFLNQFLAAVFENPDLTPVTIKNFFDFYDGMASKYCPNHPQDYSEAWKSNSLPQHYWVTTLTHPSYIFDMRQSRSADQSVSVLANMLDNACKKIIPEKNQDSSLNRVLFVKDLPRYIRTISDYYKSLASRPEPTHIKLQGEFNRLGQEFSGLFSRVGTLKLLYDFTHHDTAGLLDSITEMM